MSMVDAIVHPSNKPVDLVLPLISCILHPRDYFVTTNLYFFIPSKLVLIKPSAEISRFGGRGDWEVEPKVTLRKTLGEALEAEPKRASIFHQGSSGFSRTYSA